MDKLTVRFKLPTCKINGTEYTMLVEKYQDLGDKGTKGYDYTLEEKNGYLYVVYNKLYADECILGRICLRFPEIPGLQQGDTYMFTGNTYFFIGEEDGEEILPQKINGKDGHPFTITMEHIDGGKLEYECTEHYVEDDTIDGAVNAMGAYTLKNTGNQDTTPITVRMTFNNRQGNNNLGVTTVKLMADPAQSAGTRVKYTLMDENGNVVDNNGQPFEITLTHKYSAYDTQTQKRILFTISKATANLNLPAGHDYYFKTITYDIEKITAGYAYMSGFYDNSPGVYYGRSLTGTLASNTTGYTKIQVFDKESGEELESLQEELVTTLYVYNRGAFYLEDVTAQTPTGEYEVTAGDTFGLALQGRVYYYVYQQSAYVDDVRFGILLPKGMYISSDAKATLDIGVEVPVEKISHKEINTEENFWIIELEGGYPIGYFTEDLQKLPNGTGVKLDLKVNTSKSINERMLYFADRMFVTGDEFVHAQQYFAKDTYGLTDYHSYDTVGIIVPEKAKSLQVIPQPAKMDDDNSLTVSSGMADQAHVTLKDKGDTVTYKLNIANTKGGTAENLAYYIQIPQNGFAEGSDDRLVLSGAGNVTLTSGTELELLYTTEKNLSLDTIADNDTEVEWAETIADYSAVTMVKVVTKGNAKFTNGSESTVTLPLSYKGEEFAACAGGKVNIMTQRNYRYVQGILSGTYAGLLQVLSVSTHYTAPEEVITLTAALEGKPTDPNVKEFTYETALNFHYAHSFKITDLKTNNVTLGAHSEETLAANSNTHFQINAKMNNGTEMVIAEDGTDVGSLAAENALSFVFTLTNGDALTDVTTERYVTFNISSEAVTIPVRININRELATAKPTESGIKAGKEYLNTGAATAVTIAKNSAFTVQFVTAEMNSTNYGARTLKFKNALPAGTTVAMLDYTSDAPRYAYYRVGAPTAEIALTSFKMMGSETPYALNNNTGTFTETLLFVVDFAKASSYLSGEQTVMIHIAGKNTIEDMESNELMFTLSGVSGFAASVDRESLAYGQSFTYNFNASRVGNDSTYSGRKMSAVITGENLPADAKLIVGDQAEYKQNANKQFIIPLGENGGSISICLDSVSLKNNHQDCKLTIKLWVSATPNDSKPHRGEHVIAQDKTVTYTAAMPSSLKVTDMSDRVLRKTELSSYVTLSYATARVPEGAAVTMEVQRYVGSGYVTDSTYLERLAPASGNAGVYTVANGGGNLSMKFSPTAMETGNYRILFKVMDSSGNVLLEVPYRFVVVD
jgi:hypothetical protein